MRAAAGGSGRRGGGAAAGGAGVRAGVLGEREGAAGRRARWARGPAGAEGRGRGAAGRPRGARGGGPWPGAWGGPRALRAAEVRVGSQAGRTRKGAALRTPQDADGSARDCSPESRALPVTLGLAVRILGRTGLGWMCSEVPLPPILRSLNEKGEAEDELCWPGRATKGCELGVFLGHGSPFQGTWALLIPSAAFSSLMTTVPCQAVSLLGFWFPQRHSPFAGPVFRPQPSVEAAVRISHTGSRIFFYGEQLERGF